MNKPNQLRIPKKNEPTIKPIWNVNWFKQQCGSPRSKVQRDNINKRWSIFLDNEYKGIDWKIDINATFEQYALYRFQTGTVSADSIDSEISTINHILHDQGIGIDRKIDAVGTRHVLDGMKRVQNELFNLDNGRQARALTDDLCDTGGSRL